MSLQIPETAASPEGGYYDRPSDYTDALDAALKLLGELESSSEWEELPEREEVELAKIVNADDPSGVPITRGTTIVEGVTPLELTGVTQLPGMRKKWDPRLEEGYPIRRFSQSSFQIYSVMKSPSYFIWARDIVAVQESYWNDARDKMQLIQVSVTDDERLPEDGSYQKSRTRATVELSAWTAEKHENGTKLSYVVKVLLNGAIPSAVVSSIAQETPMCVGRVRDVYYEEGHAPIELSTKNSTLVKQDFTSTAVTQTFNDSDGEKVWIGEYVSNGEQDEITILYDSKRMYAGGVTATIGSKEGNDVSSVKANVDEANSVVKVDVQGLEKGKTFEVTIEPSA